MSQPLVFDFYNSIITVPSPDTTLDMQYLINEIRDTEDELTPGEAFPKIADASGKESLGGGIFTAITVRLLDNWRVMFEARPGPATVQVTVSGGNLVGGPGGNPVAPSAFTQVLNLSSAAGTIATPATATETTNIQYLLATMNDKQRAIGSIFYWDPYSGNDSNTGLSPISAVKTFSKAHSLVTTGAHDIVFALSSDPTGTTTVTETINITKPTLKLRGPGHVLKLVPTATTDDTVTISADNVEVSGFYMTTAITGTKNAISVSGNSILVKDCWIENARGSGISLATSTLVVISDMVIDGCGTSGSGNGISLGNSCLQTEIAKCIISQSINGIGISGTGISDNLIENCLIFNNSAYGVDIGATVARTVLRSGNTYHKNTSGATLDAGTDTYIETQAGGASASSIADAVWDEVISSHITTGTTGKALKDAKIKATLASLK